MGLIDRILGRKTELNSNSSEGYRPTNPEVLTLAWKRLRVCPVCGEDFPGHQYALLATMALAPRNRRHIEQFLKAVERREPADIALFHDWDEQGENAEAYALRCPDGNVAVAVAHTAAEAPHFKNVIRCDSLGPERSRRAEDMVSNEQWATI